MFADMVSRKLWSTARLKPAPATAGSSFSARDSATCYAGIDQQERSGRDLAFTHEAMNGVELHVHRQPHRVIDQPGDLDLPHRTRHLRALRASPCRRASRRGRRRGSSRARRPMPASAPCRPSRSTIRLKRGFGGTPVSDRYRSRWPDRTRTATERCGSTAMTPGRCASAWRAASERGSTNPTVTSCRSASQNCVSISRSIASENTNPTMRMATAKPMPTIDAEARSGWRVTLRSTMRPAAPR